MAIIDFTISVDNPVDTFALFDKIQVWRSPDQNGSPTPYIEITADAPTSAIVDGTVSGPWTMSGQTLTVLRDGADSQNVLFTGSNPLQLTSVLSQINALFPGIASEVPTDTNKVRLSSLITGTQSILLIGGTASTTLGLSNNRTNGRGARLLLNSTTQEYEFRDFDGDTTYWYKTRFYNSVTGAVSTFSDPHQGGTNVSFPSGATVVGSFALADMTGQPIPARRFIFVPVSAQVVADSTSRNYAILPSVNRIEVLTDQDGRGTVTLMVGQTVKVFIEGTVFQREFVVPSSNFDVMTVATTQPDPLNIVQSPPIPIRMS